MKDFSSIFNEEFGDDDKYLNELYRQKFVKEEEERLQRNVLNGYLAGYGFPFNIQTTPEENDYYHSLFSNMSNNYFYIARNSEEIQKVGKFFLFNLPISSGRIDKHRNYRAINAQVLIDSYMNKTEANVTVDDTHTDFIIVIVLSKIGQYNYGPQILTMLANNRKSVKKPVLFLSTISIPELESLDYIVFKTYNDYVPPPPKPVVMVQKFNTNSTYEKKDSFEGKISYKKQEESNKSPLERISSVTNQPSKPKLKVTSEASVNPLDRMSNAQNKKSGKDK